MSNTSSVRSTDDVFDIYERAVGGNSTFLLNIPPNRDGKFSPTDVAVLKETGQRIRETYGTDLFRQAKGPKEVLDQNADTYVTADKDGAGIVISTPQPVTLNRLVLQEAIATNGERVERHAVDAWIDGGKRSPMPPTSATNESCASRMSRRTRYGSAYSNPA